ncbi:acyl-CoA dehydrogenase family protein [Gracilibacillus kekensis]|uniref:Acyl-CoA dehydrogenase n=1 Tax=Gracilibacillus kekensis TaxID=1027249 RepID=A0A1M7JLG2_9BACI|nr:acyl-CoA dehydrogenase family protein [Gracilibacillus kekensis]SHM53806.1 Acyl-CoA dehydrogenase [Gracilibacillus kekensis]
MTIVSENNRSYIEDVIKLSEIFAERANQVDEDALFPHENFEDIKENGLLALTVPKEYGGSGIDLVEFLQVQQQLAKGDGPTALSLGWQLGVILEQAENRNWSKENFEKVSRLIVEERALINLAQTEKATGSPSRGGIPTTIAKKEQNGWRINGAKSFTSMAVALDYSIVTVDVNQTGTKGYVLIDHSLPGVKVNETWDSISMRATKSDDLILENVFVAEDALLFEETPQKPFPKGWYLQIPAVYLGIAEAARDYAIKFASDFQPITLPHPIKEVPEVRRKIGEIELELVKAREVLYGVATKWVEHPETRSQLGAELQAAKHIVTNSANTIVDLAMRIVGARSLSAKNPLQRHFRDVRAGLHNPPTDDAIVYNLAKNVLDS